MILLWSMLVRQPLVKVMAFGVLIRIIINGPDGSEKMTTLICIEENWTIPCTNEI
jgi:hypothetical protein